MEEKSYSRLLKENPFLRLRNNQNVIWIIMLFNINECMDEKHTCRHELWRRGKKKIVATRICSSMFQLSSRRVLNVVVLHKTFFVLSNGLIWKINDRKWMDGFEFVEKYWNRLLWHYLFKICRRLFFMNEHKKGVKSHKFL